MRVEGLYWVKHDDVIEPAYWLDDAWSVIGTAEEYGDSDFDWIGDRIQEPEGIPS